MDNEALSSLFSRVATALESMPAEGRALTLELADALRAQVEETENWRHVCVQWHQAAELAVASSVEANRELQVVMRKVRRMEARGKDVLLSVQEMARRDVGMEWCRVLPEKGVGG